MATILKFTIRLRGEQHPYFVFGRFSFLPIRSKNVYRCFQPVEGLKIGEAIYVSTIADRKFMKKINKYINLRKEIIHEYS